MRKGSKFRNKIEDLEKQIRICEGYKKKLLKFVNELKNKYLEREISYGEYEKLLNDI